VSAEIERLFQTGVIERVDASPWVSPIVVVKKKSGNICMGIDLLYLNSIKLITDSVPLPHIDEILSLLLFSTINLESGYFQLPA